MRIFFLVLSIVPLAIAGSIAFLARDFYYGSEQKQVGIVLWVLFGCVALILLKLGGLSIFASFNIVVLVSAIGYFETELKVFLLRKFKDSGIS